MFRVLCGVKGTGSKSSQKTLKKTPHSTKLEKISNRFKEICRSSEKIYVFEVIKLVFFTTVKPKEKTSIYSFRSIHKGLLQVFADVAGKREEDGLGLQCRDEMLPTLF